MDIDDLLGNGLDVSADAGGGSDSSSELDFEDLMQGGLDHSLASKLTGRRYDPLADEPFLQNLEDFEGTGPIKYKLDKTAGKPCLLPTRTSAVPQSVVTHLKLKTCNTRRHSRRRWPRAGGVKCRHTQRLPPIYRGRVESCAVRFHGVRR